MAASLHGQTAFVTGSAKRLGEAMVLALAAQGVNVVVQYRYSMEEANSVRARAEELGVRAWVVQVDFAEPGSYADLIPRILEMTGGLDILVNSAAIFPRDTMETVTLEHVCHNMSINGWAPFALSREFARSVRVGKILNMLDARLSAYDWNHVAYIISKHALAVFTRMMAVEYAPHITVNAIAPGLVLPPPGKDEAYLQGLTGSIPLKRHGRAQDIVDAALFLLTSTFITGEVIYVDGGRHLLEHLRGPDPHQ